MKKVLISFFLFVFVYFPANSSTFLFSYLEDSYFQEKNPALAAKNELVGISDVFYEWDAVNQNLYVTQQEWLGDGKGGSYKAPYKSSFIYKGLNPDNFDDFLSVPEWNNVVNSFRNQLEQYENLDHSKFDGIYAQTINSSISNAVQERFALTKNNPGGAIWVQALHNNLKELELNGSAISSAGLIIGADKALSQNFKLGLGLYINSAIADLNNDDVNISTYSAFLYGQYRYKNFYVNGNFDYNYSQYKESEIKNKTNAYGANVYFGYNITNSFMPEIGAKYVHVNPYTFNYFDYYSIEGEKSDYLTMSAGARFAKTFGIFDMSLNANLTYLLINETGDRIENLYSYKYSVIRESDKNNIGAEGGAKIGVKWKNLYANVGYDINWTPYFVNHRIKLDLRSRF